MTQETKDKIQGIIGIPLEEHDLKALGRIIIESLSPFSQPPEKPLILKDGTKTFIIKRSDICGIEYEEDKKMIMIRRISGEHHSFTFSKNEEVLENFIQDFKDGF